VIVVADTSVLNYLIRIKKTELLHTLYGRVIIAHAVLDEMRARGAPVEVRSWAQEYADWIELASANEAESFLPKRLGAGERETIAIARKLNAQVVLMDDLPGRLAAEAVGLYVSGTLAVLLQGSRLGLLDFHATLAELKELGFRVSPKVERAMHRLAMSK